MRNKATQPCLRTCLLLALALGMGLATGAAQAPSNPAFVSKRPLPTRPNIVVIMADDLGYGDLGCYGQKKIKTPNIDRLAAEGMRFTQCYAGGPASGPSRVALLTGLHSGHSSVRGEPGVPVPAEQATIAEILKKVRYRTGGFGRWDLGGAWIPEAQQPLASAGVLAGSLRGLDEWFGFLDPSQAQNHYPLQLTRNDRQYQVDQNQYGNRGIYSQDLFTKVATEYIRVSRYGSFFMYLAYTLPGPKMDIASDAPYSNESWPPQERAKAAMITRLDTDVGMVMSALRKHGVDTNTVIFFCSDNGPHAGGGVNPAFFKSSGPLRGIAGDLYEGGIRVPMIVRWPGRIKPGSVSDQPWAFWDFVPTALEIAKQSPVDGIDGISILPTLLSQTQTNQHKAFYWEFHSPTNATKQAVRMDKWKAVRQAPELPWELYNLTTDLGETNNVATQHPTILKRAEATAAAARVDSPLWPLKRATELRR